MELLSSQNRNEIKDEEYVLLIRCEILEMRFGFMDDSGILKIVVLLDEPEVKVVVFVDVRGVGGEGGTSGVHGDEIEIYG